jgi:hypothetical protein
MMSWKIYDVVYDVVYNIVYDVVYDVTWFIQPAARLLHQPTLLPSDGASKLQLLSTLILERAPPLLFCILDLHL